jgi:hypothetical protein
VLTRLSWVLVLAAAAGCSGDGGSNRSPDYNWDSSDPGSTGVAIKLSYVRFDPDTDAKGRQGKWVHQYKYMLSEGWMVKRGPSPREPFERHWRRGAYVGENIHDQRMIEMVQKMDAAGFRQLRETPLNQIDIEKLKRIEQTGDRDAAQKTRIITVETENSRRTVTSYDNADPASAKIFHDVERLVVIFVFGNTIQVTKDTQSTMPRSKN